MTKSKENSTIQGMILRGVFMDNLAKAAYAYEEWYRLFQIETKESISLVNPQILQSYWISINSAKADAVSYTHLTLPTICSV